MGERALPAAFVVAAALSVGLLLTGRTFAGSAGVVLFGGGGLFLWWVRRTGAAQGEQRRTGERATRYGRLPRLSRYSPAPGGLVFLGSASGAGVGVAGAAIFVVLGSVMVAAPLVGPADEFTDTLSPPTLFLGGLLAISFFGAALLAQIKVLLTRSPGILLVPDGVYLRTPWGSAWVRWEDLAGVRLGAEGVHLIATAPERMALTGLHRLRHGSNRRKHGMDVHYDYAALRAGGHVVVEKIYYYLHYPAKRHQLGDPAMPLPE